MELAIKSVEKFGGLVVSGSISALVEVLEYPEDCFYQGVALHKSLASQVYLIYKSANRLPVLFKSQKAVLVLISFKSLLYQFPKFRLFLSIAPNTCVDLLEELQLVFGLLDVLLLTLACLHGLFLEGNGLLDCWTLLDKFQIPNKVQLTLFGPLNNFLTNFGDAALERLKLGGWDGVLGARISFSVHGVYFGSDFNSSLLRVSSF